MGAYNINTHPVTDFDASKTVFDRIEPVCKEGSELSAVGLRHSADPNVVTVVNTWDTVEAAQAFFVREDLKAGMDEAGVTAPPSFVFANAE